MFVPGPRERIPAALVSEYQVHLYPPEPAGLEQLLIKDGQKVADGDLVAILSSPDVDYQIQQAQRKITRLQKEIDLPNSAAAVVDRRSVQMEELATAMAEHSGLADAKTRFNLLAPISGKITSIAEGAVPGHWMSRKVPLVEIVDQTRWVVEAYVPEALFGEIAIGNVGWFYPGVLDYPPVDARVSVIDHIAIQTLQRPYLAETYGGSIAVKLGKDGKLVPEKSLFRVILSLNTPGSFKAEMSGTVQFQKSAEAPISKMWRAILNFTIMDPIISLLH